MNTQPRNVYKVENGESIYQIASKTKGNADYWRELLIYNNLKIFDSPVVGDLLNLPTLDELKQITVALANPVSTLTDLAVDTIRSRTLPTNMSTEVLDLSRLKQPATGDYSLISWLI